MRRALALARKALGRVSPNPAVGAVLAKDGRVIGEGYTQPPGEPHAEVVALLQAAEHAQGATLYVTLEPCSHHGRTPPCADSIIASGVERVVCALQDPNPLVSGQGIERLRGAGVRVEVGLYAEEAAHLNEAFLTFITQKRPFTILKAASSLDGKIATRAGDSQWISSEVSRAYVHRLRRQVDAVMVGIGTALRDNPRLTPRPPGRVRPGSPIRIVVDSQARLPLTSTLFDDLPRYPLFIAVGDDAPADRINSLAQMGAEVLPAPDDRGRVDLVSLYRQLAHRDITSVLLEGGGELAASALQADLVDKAIFFLAPLLIGGRDAKTALEGNGPETLSLATPLHAMSVHRSGPDLRVEGYLHPMDLTALVPSSLNEKE
jgi:diaminohydroxyphosphoribosylaminopyrimidine deaminase/5-amino-6-(5-phosphoribosylamino)uracil reductase